VGVDLKKVSPRYTWAAQRQPPCTCMQLKACTPIHATVASTSRVCPPLMVEKQMETCIDPPLPCCVGRMYVQWREREHEASNELVATNLNVVAVLTQCRLVKFFLCLFMHAQPRLLNALVDYWHPDVEAFMLEGKSLVPTIEDIYFLTDLSRRGEPVNFQTFPVGPSKVSELIDEYCEAGMVWFLISFCVLWIMCAKMYLHVYVHDLFICGQDANLKCD
jgi:hypothetical protein